jgi:predicted nuclease of predicted toxin-antitoxin system
MGTLASELGSHVERDAIQPRIYVDANMPARLVAFMRTVLRWDVLFVIEHDDLRRARDGEHYRLARQLRRTLITLDRDYLDDRKFPMGESAGVLVLTAPDERGFVMLLKRLDKEIFLAPLPLEGRKLHVHVDWVGVRGTGGAPGDGGTRPAD